MKLMNFLTKYKYTIIITLVALMIFILGVLFVKTYIYPRAQKVEGYRNDSEQSVNLIMFHVTWCPYCKTAKPIWDKVRDNYDGVVVNKRKISIMSIDATDETSVSPEFNTTIEKVMHQFKKNGNEYEIEGYPTIILSDSKHNVIAEFDKNTTYENLETFITQNL